MAEAGSPGAGEDGFRHRPVAEALGRRVRQRWLLGHSSRRRALSVGSPGREKSSATLVV